MSTRFPTWSLLVALAVPLSCSSDDDKPSALGSGAAAGSAGTSSRSGSGNGEPGGEGSLGAAGGAAHGGASGSPSGEIGGEGVYVGEGGSPSNPQTLCRRDVEWSTTPLDAVNTAADELLLAMTPDEDTFVFSRDDQLFVSDEGELTLLTLPVGYTHELGVSLTADGLSLVVVAENGSGFAEVSRSSRGSAFSASASTARFAILNDARVTSGDSYSFPALTQDGQDLYYTARRGPSVANVWRAYGPSLSERDAEYPGTLGTDDGLAKLVVSISADERTIFVLDEALGYVTGLWRAAPTAEFGDPVPLEGFLSVVPNGDCDRIYGTVEIDGSLDIVSGSPK